MTTLDTQTPPQAPTETSYKPRTLPFVILGAVILALAIFMVIRWVSQVEPKKAPPTRENIPFVTLQPVVLGDNQARFSAGGFVSAKNRSNIAAEVNGRILSLASNFAVGKRVSKGEILASVDDSDYVAALATAKANLASAKSTYAQEQAQSRQAARDAKHLGVKSTDLLLRKPQLAAAKAAISNAEAQLTLAKQNLAKTRIKAPFNALIQARNISLGDTVSANTVVAQLIGVETFTVKLTLDTAQFNLVNVGDSVMLDNPDTGISYSAIINRFDPTLNESTRTVGAYVDIDNPLAAEKPLLLNTYLQATIVGKTLSDSMWIDNNANIEDQFVWGKSDDDTLVKKAFTLLYRDTAQSLVRFNEPMNAFITNPQDSFFVGEKVTTTRQQTGKSKRPKPSPKGDE